MDDTPDRGRDPLKSVPLRVLVAVLAAEAVGLAAASAFLVVELATVTPDSYPSAIAITVLAVFATIAVGAIALAALKGQPWMRGAAITVQVLLIAVAVGSFQGIFARPDIGWLLLVPAIAVLVLLFTRPVMAATTRPEG